LKNSLHSGGGGWAGGGWVQLGVKRTDEVSLGVGDGGGKMKGVAGGRRKFSEVGKISKKRDGEGELLEIEDRYWGSGWRGKGVLCLGMVGGQENKRSGRGFLQGEGGVHY